MGCWRLYLDQDNYNRLYNPKNDGMEKVMNRYETSQNRLIMRAYEINGVMHHEKPYYQRL